MRSTWELGGKNNGRFGQQEYGGKIIVTIKNESMVDKFGQKFDQSPHTTSKVLGKKNYVIIDNFKASHW